MIKVINKLVTYGMYIILPIIIIIAYLINYIAPISFAESLSFLLLMYVMLNHMMLKNVNKILYDVASENSVEFDDNNNVQKDDIPSLQDANIDNQSNAQAERMQMVGYMSSTIIHDLNNLLTAIIGFSDLLLIQSSGNDKNHAQLLEVRKNADNASKLVLNMLSFIKQKDIEQKVISIQAILRNIRHLLFWILGKNIQLSIDCTDEVKCIHINPTELEQIIMNIIINAKDAIGSDCGKINIKVQNIFLDEHYLKKQKYDYFSGQNALYKGEYVVLSVSDNGSGINQTMLAKMFRPFKSDKTHDTAINRSGSGLGLFNVQRIVRNAKGLIGVKTTVNQGTLFDLFFKKHKGKCVVKDILEKKNNVKPKRVRKLDGTILIVDNESSVRIFVSCALKNYGFKIAEAKDAEEALDIMNNANNDVKIVITDISMNKMSGIELAQEIEKKYPEVKTIIMSGYIDALMNSTEKSKYNFLSKPYTLDDLIANVNKCCE